MKQNSLFYDRIGEQLFDIKILAQSIGNEYDIGRVKSAELVEFGYEDFNVIVTTDKQEKYFLKVFNSSRTDGQCRQCIERAFIASQNGVPTPKVYKNKTNELVTKLNLGFPVRASLLEYVNGKDFYNLKRKPTLSELDQIVEIAGCLNKIDYKPDFIYDTWAISCFDKEFEKKCGLLDKDDLEIIEPIYREFKKLNYESLPKGFVHGDMLTTNLMIDDKHQIKVIDFSVSNWTARLNEIAVIASDICITDDVEESKTRIKRVFSQWCKNVGATEFEIKSFPLLFAVASASKIMNGAAYEIEKGEKTQETQTHYKRGKFNLGLINNSKCKEKTNNGGKNHAPHKTFNRRNIYKADGENI